MGLFSCLSCSMAEWLEAWPLNPGCLGSDPGSVAAAAAALIIIVVVVVRVGVGAVVAVAAAVWTSHRVVG